MPKVHSFVAFGKKVEEPGPDVSGSKVCLMVIRGN